MTMVPYVYRGTTQYVHDADTLHIILDLGFGLQNMGTAKALPGMLVRLLGCNAQELNLPGGKEARDAVAVLVPSGTEVLVTSVSWDKYGGRVLGRVELPDGTDLATLLVGLQWAAAWDGVGARPVPPWPRTV